ncbi:hypothetical protein AX15_003282 [Amanita polypyramis BW_CC]|nr:hypothetical protein AX15_003282 [Amanita polypyramis BW_CC]
MKKLPRGKKVRKPHPYRVLTCPNVSYVITKQRSFEPSTCYPMPADRSSFQVYLYDPVNPGRSNRFGVKSKTTKAATDVGAKVEIQDDECDPLLLWSRGRRAEDVYYPKSDKERANFKLKDGKRVPSHHWDVYDHILAIPAGRVTTYKDVALAVGGSPRSVGNALRNNPFNPYVPCHRVIASDLTLGGYFGKLSKEDKTGTRYHQKLGILAKEGVKFTENGRLAYLDPAQVIWKGIAD